MAKQPQLAVSALVRRDREILMIRRGRGPAMGRWSVPGGRVEHGESLSEAVERELLEETGLSGNCGRFVGWVERISAGEHGEHFVILDFEVTLLDDREPTAGDDAAEVRWVAISDLGQLQLVDGLADFLQDHWIEV